MQNVKKARKQVDEPKPNAEAPGVSYNIWYHKNPVCKELFEENILIRAATRCVLLTDEGLTKAPKETYICIHFIRGQCCMGYDCKYLHRLPNSEDLKRIPMTKDIFGRDRHSTDRDDMGGVGNFNRENKTLFVGQLPAKARDLERELIQQFSEWGEIEDLNVIGDRSIAFIRYSERANAEIAKEAMHCQSLGYNDVLNVRWAMDDPDPKKQKERQEEERKAAIQMIIKRAALLKKKEIEKNKSELLKRKELYYKSEEKMKKDPLIDPLNAYYASLSKSLNENYSNDDNLDVNHRKEEITTQIPLFPPGIHVKRKLDEEKEYVFPDVSEKVDFEIEKQRKARKVND